MIPTWLDIQMQAEFNREQAMKTAEINHIMRMQRKLKIRSIESRIVRFGAWLERIGCRLQNRYAICPGLEVNMNPVNEVRLQNC